MRKQLIFAVLVIVVVLSNASCADKTTEIDRPEQIETPAQTVYTIADYYNENGELSALGQALEEQNTEKVLNVKTGDIIVVGDLRYQITAESLTLPFYTQSSIEEVIVWWTEYMDTWVDRGEAVAVR